MMLTTLRISRWLRCALGVCCVLSYSLLALAQDGAASLHGTVSDADGAAVSNAHLSVVLQGSDADAQSVTVNASGDYTISGLSPGVYRIKVETAGFKTIVVTNLSLTTGDSQELKFTLEAGSAEDIISIDSGEQPPAPENSL